MVVETPIKPYKAKIMLRVLAGVAKPNPKMGQALGPLGINMMQFCKDFNNITNQYRADVPLRVELWAYPDRTYTFNVRAPETSWFIKKAIGKEKCTNMAGWIVNDTIGIKYCYEIAKVKQEIDEDLKHLSLKSLTSQIVNQCKSMGISVVLDRDKPQPIKPHLKM